MWAPRDAMARTSEHERGNANEGLDSAGAVYDRVVPESADDPTLTFLGGAGTVTGSRFLLETSAARVLVDCGLFQGEKALRLKNWERFPVDPGSIDALVVTHAHVDHCGYVPALYREGFRGPIHATPDTAALVRIVLPDSGHLQEEEAWYANRKGFSKHRPALPLYTEADAIASLGLLQPVPFGRVEEVAPRVRVTFRPAGHILGSASALVEVERTGGRRALRVLFSGDVGRPVHPLLVPPAPVGDVDVIVAESTYGDRTHDDAGAPEELAAVIRRTAGRGGTVVVPAFAVDRTEVVLHVLKELRTQGAIPPLLPIFVDSPMALDALAVYRAAIARRSPDLRSGAGRDGDPFDPGSLHEVRDRDGSIGIDTISGPSIVVSASGMATGGRVLHHLARRLPDPRSSVVLVGFQAAGTRGRLLADGAATIRMLGRDVPVRAEIATLPSFSVHADQRELVDWLATATEPPRRVFLVHGEPDASTALAQVVAERLGYRPTPAGLGETVTLEA